MDEPDGIPMNTSRGLLPGLLIAVLLLALADASGRAQPQGIPPKPAVPVEPIAAIVDAFRSHSVVTFSDPHGNEQLEAFRLMVVRDPRIIGVINDIVVEMGNARYQDLMDRYLRGEDVPYQTLRQVWDNTTQQQILTMETGVPAFYRAIRAVNASLSRERQIRVLLGDPPIDWDAVQTADDFQKWLALRDTHPADLIQREVLAQQRHVLVIYGQMHAQRKNLLANYASDGIAETLISRLESKTGIKAFTIWWDSDLALRQPDATSWPIPSLASLRGTIPGAADFAAYRPTPARFTTTFMAIPRDQWRTLRMEDQFDAVLYLGPSAAMTTAQPSPALCSDRAYVAARLARMTLIGLPPPELDRLRQLCSVAPPK
jgi:hypothetical protein